MLKTRRARATLALVLMFIAFNILSILFGYFLGVKVNGERVTGWDGAAVTVLCCYIAIMVVGAFFYVMGKTLSWIYDGKTQEDEETDHHAFSDILDKVDED